jgi:uncharacterized membrane protein YeaQ/YmgE (transglycosylase-associated protein family)
MTLETLLLWIVVGLIAGFLASLVVGRGYGMLGDIIIGVVGSFIGGAIFRAAHWSAPFGGIAGTITVAFLGAVILLLVLRLFNRRRAVH